MEHEQLFPGRQTYARYLHVAEAAAEDEAQAAWDGLGGRLKALRREVVDVKAEVKADVTMEDGDAAALWVTLGHAAEQAEQQRDARRCVHNVCAEQVQLLARGASPALRARASPLLCCRCRQLLDDPGRRVVDKLGLGLSLLYHL